VNARGAVLAVAWLLAAGAVRAETLVVMPVKLLDTSQEADDQRAAHERRLAMVGAALAADLRGGTFETTLLADPAAIEATCPRPTAAACLIGFARDLGGDKALFTVVQKTSTLILQVFAHVVDTGTTALVASRDLNFRGDTDEAWMRMEGFLAEQLADATSGAPRR
jgi:hypothetical protein